MACPSGWGWPRPPRWTGKSHRVYVLLGDAELQEGSVWEAIMAAPSLQLTNLIAIVDRNTQGVDGPTEELIPLEPLRRSLASLRLGAARRSTPTRSRRSWTVLPGRKKQRNPLGFSSAAAQRARACLSWRIILPGIAPGRHKRRSNWPSGKSRKPSGASSNQERGCG
ncbi:MAG: hypothetical protein ACOX20_01035 [Limnochordia bacterium]